MEQQRNIRRRIRSQASPMSKDKSPFPIDLISEILLRLPVKSVLRFRCVSKQWSSLTNDPYFTDSWSSKKPNPLLICHKESDKLFVFSIPQNSDVSSSLPTDCYYIKLPESSSFFPTESVHGLICFKQLTKPVVFNPTVRRFFTLPEPEKSWNNIICFLGYDPIQGKHKLVCFLSYKTTEECRVLTLGSVQESWRRIETKYKHNPFGCRSGVCINGVVYYKAIDHSNAYIIMSFDVRSEKFGMIKFPRNYNVSRWRLILYEGIRLATVTNSLKRGMELWVLEDAEKHEWSRKCFPGLKSQMFYRLRGITQGGEFIYLPSTICFLPRVPYFGPKKTGLGYDEFRLSNGLVDRGRYPISASSNHIETFMSL